MACPLEIFDSFISSSNEACRASFVALFAAQPKEQNTIILIMTSSCFAGFPRSVLSPDPKNGAEKLELDEACLDERETG